jgi:hypothetical protein
MLFNYFSGQQQIDDNKKCRRIAGNFDCHAGEARLVIPVFRNLFFGPKAFPTGFLRISFSCVFLRNISEERGFGGGRSNSCFFRFYRIFSQEFLWDRNSCFYSGFLRIPEDS